MKVIKMLACKIEEEMHDAEEYAKLAFQYKSEYPELSETLLQLSREEVTHMNMLHIQAERLIKAYQDKGGETPPAMRAIYDWEHEKMIDGMARIKTMQDMVR